MTQRYTLDNRVKKRLREGEVVIGYWLTLPAPSVAEILAGLPVDWLLVDLEHGPVGWETLEDMLRAMAGTPVVPMVRVPAGDPAVLKRALDRGPLGVVVPLVDSAEEAQRVVAACKYPPEGIRGVAGSRASRYGATLPEYFAAWNREVLVVCQVETVRAVEQVEEIAAVPGVDVLFVGPNDLSANLNRWRDLEFQGFRDAVDRVLEAARRHGKAAGVMCTGPEDALRRIAQGFRFVALSSDARLLAGAATAALEAVRRVPADPRD
ncbi:MAG: aldolase/citrate lyase family protein [Armatimonadota bacterium]|nr:aldolase/citrate lyase family protein [Armatimonadota bacterium]MDR5696158.1 aldolase/citrate lyase family protein [Armatimonadota bacterium]